MKELFRFIVHQNRLQLFGAVAVTLLAGLSSIVLLKFIKNIVKSGTTPDLSNLLWILVFTIAYAIIIAITNYLIAIIVSKTECQLQMSLGKQVLQKPLSEVERHGPKMANSIFRETRAIALIVKALLNSSKNFIILLFLIGYAFWLSPPVTLFAIFVRFTFVFISRGLKKKFRKVLSSERNTQYTIRKQLGTLYDGVKEFHLNGFLKATFYRDEVVKHCKKNQRQTARIALLENTLSRGSQMIILVAGVGFAYFLFAQAWINLVTTTNLLIVFILARERIASISKVAVKKEQLRVALDELDKLNLNLRELDLTDFDQPVPLKTPIESIELKDVTFAHQITDTQESFVLGPINLKINSSGILFIVGNNGSGKSTLAKLICGLYPPQSGEIHYNNTLVNESNRANYCQLFSAIFSDFHLFEARYRTEDKEQLLWARELLHSFEVDECLGDETQSVNTPMSTGQRKRLALALTLIENRPIILLDEWAAEQDPKFRTHFYQEILPQLKAKGKLVIVITHHHEFCHLADQVISIEKGKVSAVSAPSFI